MTSVVVLTRNWSSWPDFAGSTWVPIQYVAGFRRMGVEAVWVDYLDRVDPRRNAHSLEYLIERFEATARDFGFSGRFGVVYDGGARHFGLAERDLEALAAGADLLLAVSGKGLPPGSPWHRMSRRAYVDVDPGFTQMWAHKSDMGLDRFNLFFTVGLNVGRPGSPIPTLGLRWHTILPPVVLELWPAHVDEQCTRFSTVGDWWGSQFVRFDGELYGSKREEFLKFMHVPLEAGQPMEAALSIYQCDHEELGQLGRHNWKVLDPYLYAGDPQAYREFIRYSRAEFSVAKNGYVRSASGWVSDRSACYLASGKPVLVQSTGIEPHLPTGRGLLTFRTPEEAVAGIRAINADYAAHARAARQIAERHFDSELVLGSILERAGL